MLLLSLFQSYRFFWQINYIYIHMSNTLLFWWRPNLQEPPGCIYLLTLKSFSRFPNYGHIWSNDCMFCSLSRSLHNLHYPLVPSPTCVWWSPSFPSGQFCVALFLFCVDFCCSYTWTSQVSLVLVAWSFGLMTACLTLMKFLNFCRTFTQIWLLTLV